ncbi:MAG: nicotinate-nucleotide adenylyltransferase [Candidatus Bipolaricaulota bacterium]
MTLKGRVGVFGGAFDPPHNAHLDVALEALHQFELASVVFVPNGVPPQRPEPLGGSAEDRFDMVVAMIAGHPQLAASRIEIDRKGPSYTIDTIRVMREDYPLGLCFILGADRLATIGSWREAGALLREVPLLVAPRAGMPLSSMRGPLYDGASIHVLSMREIDLSSSAVRSAVGEGRSIGRWVPPGVAAIIKTRGLYRRDESG